MAKTLKVRQHRGGFAESMLTVEMIEPTFAALMTWILRTNQNIEPEHAEENLSTSETFNDIRNGWTHTRSIYISGHSVVGYVDLESIDSLYPPKEN